MDPRSGGPREGVLKRGAFLREIGHHVDVATLDAPDEPYLKGLPVGVIPLGPARTGYRFAPKLIAWLKQHGAEYDGIVVNGLWQFHGLATLLAMRSIKKPYVVFTHGMLDPWFKRTYPRKHLKKWLYWAGAEYWVLRGASAVLFTSEEERLSARQSFWLYRAKEQVVPYGTSPPVGDPLQQESRFRAAFPQLTGKSVLLFLSRIHEKKGCDLLIEAFARVADANPGLHLVIAGSGSDELVASLQRLAQRLGVAGRICWPGLLQGEMKWGAFRAADAFVLPSHQENFGIAVAEALSCALPVLISKRVNIWREIVEDSAGLVGEDTIDGTEEMLRGWLAMAPADRDRMSEQALACFEKRFRVESMAYGLLDVFKALKS